MIAGIVDNRRGRVAVIVIASLGALLLATAGVDMLESVRLLRHAGVPGWLPTSRGEVFRVAQVRPGGPADGRLRVGDEIVAVDGHGITAGLDPRFTLAGPPRPYPLVVRRDGRILALTLETIPYGLSVPSFILVALLMVSGLFLVTGGAVFLLRPNDTRAQLLAVTFALFSATGQTSYRLDHLPGWECVLLLTGQALSLLFWPALLHFFLVFPETSPLLRRFPRLPALLYVVPLALIPVVGWVSWQQVKDPVLASAMSGLASPLAWVMFALMLTYLLTALASLVLTYRKAGASSRRKLRVIVTGTLAGFLPFLCVVVLGVFVDLLALGIWPARILLFWTVLSLPLVPLSFAYAIVRHQVIPIRLIIRRGARYLLVSRGFYLVEAVAVLLAIAFVLTGSRAEAIDRMGGRADILATGLAGLLVFGLLQLLNRRVMPRIDRRFFRHAYDAQAIQAEIGEAARGLASIEGLLTLAAERIQGALHPETVAVFLWDEPAGSYTCAFPARQPLVAMSPGTPLVQALQRSPTPTETDEGGLFLPIVAKGDLIGILALGPRLAELPYSREDRQLLSSIAWQLAFAIENTRLVRRRAEEERLRREIVMASEVQRRLFPDRPPDSCRLDLAGLCIPAQGVGGDYYDFLELRDGLIGIAVADVAGKGISAALLMSVVQASLRSQAGTVALTDLVVSMNRLLYRSAARNRFASFFYAEFDETTDRLSFVNAGHNPPLLLRTSGGEIGAQFVPGSLQAENGGSDGAVAVEVAAAPATLRRLSTGGLVIGVLPATTYEQDVVQMMPGDLLVAYTDGVTEAFSADDEEFGEERLQAVVEASSHLPASAVADAVVAAVQRFAGDTPQHDDITLVVAKVRP